MRRCRHLAHWRPAVFSLLVTCFFIGWPAQTRRAAAAPGTGNVDTANLGTEGACSPIVVGMSGDVTVNVECRMPLSPKELEELKEAVAKLSKSSERRSKLPRDMLDRYEKLSRQLGVKDQVLETFFRILNEKLGEDHPNTIRTLINLGFLCLKQGRNDEAKA